MFGISVDVYVRVEICYRQSKKTSGATYDGGMYRLQNSYVYYKFYLLQVLKSSLTSKKKTA